MANTIQKESKIIYLQIGQNYENLGVQKQFDVSEWTAEFPDAHIYLLFKRPGEEAAAPVNTTLDEDGILTWTVSNWETGIIGIGFAEIRAIDSSTGLVKKSHVIPCSIEASVTDEDAAPDYPSWVDRMLRFGENVDSIYATLPHELEEGIASIQQEAQTQTEAIEQKGITTRASIPSDYTTLSDDVTSLKSAISVTTVYNVSKNLYDPSQIAAGYINQTNGDVGSSTTKSYSDWIPVGSSFVISVELLTNSDFRYAIYNANKTYISGGFVPSFTQQDGRYYLLIQDVNAAYFRFSDRSNLMTRSWQVENGSAMTSYEAYYTPYYGVNENLEIKPENVYGLPSALTLLDTVNETISNIPVKGSNIVTADNTHIGICYASYGNIVTDSTVTSYRYISATVKQNTRYFVNLGCRYWILADANDSIISSGSTSISTYYIDTGIAEKLYYTVTLSDYNNGLIISEGLSGSLETLQKPDFISGINQNVFDSWFAVALTSGLLRFTVGLSETLYYHNMLALEKNVIALSLGEYSSQQSNGVLYAPTHVITRSNAYGYSIFDDNLSIVASLPRGGRNRISVYADNVQSCSALLFGDSIIAYGQIGQKMLDEFTSRSKTLTLLGTLGTGENRNEGRAGWTSDNYFTNKQYKSVVNPFYNATSETFDFSYYMTNAGYASVDFVVLHIGANDLYNTALSDARERISDTADNICAMIDSILAFNPTQKIIVQLFSPVSSNVSYVGPVQQKLIRAKFANFNAYMLVLLSKYSTVRISNDYLILDPDTDISDNIHPNQGGMEKIGVELLSQINCWQQDS